MNAEQLQRRRRRRCPPRRRQSRRGCRAASSGPSIRIALFVSLVLIGSTTLGCLELIRRPTTNAPISKPPLGNLAGQVDVKKVEASADSAAADGNTAALTPSEPVEQSAVAITPVATIDPVVRTGDARESIKKVNEYVLWCIRQGMWGEAQHHLEQTVRTDSLSASLHNNLGIVYERLGERQKAAAAYNRASQLNGDNEVYRLNLQLLEQSGRFEHGDTSATAADDDSVSAAQASVLE